MLGQKEFEQDVKKKTIVDGDVPVATKNTPKLSAPTPADNTHDEDVVGPTEIQFWSDLRNTQVVTKMKKSPQAQERGRIGEGERTSPSDLC